VPSVMKMQHVMRVLSINALQTTMSLSFVESSSRSISWLEMQSCNDSLLVLIEEASQTLQSEARLQICPYLQPYSRTNAPCT